VDPWHIINILGYITLNFLPISLMIMAVLEIFQALMWVGVHIGKFFIDAGVRYILDTIITWCGNMLVSGWLAVLLHYYNRLNVVMD